LTTARTASQAASRSLPGADGRPAAVPGIAAGLAARIARDIGDRQAAAWVHAPALAAHAAQARVMPSGLDAPGDPASVIRAAVSQVAAAHPLLAGLADQDVNPIWDAAPQPEDAARILALWRAADLVPEPYRIDGYLPGDIYQAVSAEARKGRALCQTPRFVTRLLLDISHDPAAEEWGPEHLRMIDPACGTGHILVEMLIRAWIARPSWRRTLGEQVDQALAAVHGVDIDRYAVLVARYRLLVMACSLGGRRLMLASLPAGIPVRVEAADSLLDHDSPLLERGRYHVVVANPPYITCKDPVQREQVRRQYAAVCKGKFSLAVPFEPLMHDLCVPGGWVARITASSFMRREFGKPLIEGFLTGVDLQWIIDTSGAYIPGHGTPTVILASRAQPPSSPTIRAILGKRGEPSRPADPARGLVWSSIATAVRERRALEALGRAIRSSRPAAGTGKAALRSHAPQAPSPGLR
jgi:hypothetical protein